MKSTYHQRGRRLVNLHLSEKYSLPLLIYVYLIIIFKILCRLEAFSSALGKYSHAQHIEQMPIVDIEGVVNSGVAEPYSASEIMSLLKVRFELQLDQSSAQVLAY